MVRMRLMPRLDIIKKLPACQRFLLPFFALSARLFVASQLGGRACSVPNAAIPSPRSTAFAVAAAPGWHSRSHNHNHYRSDNHSHNNCRSRSHSDNHNRSHSDNHNPPYTPQ